MKGLERRNVIAYHTRMMCFFGFLFSKKGISFEEMDDLW